MVMKAKVVFLEFQKEGKNFFPVEPDGFLNKCVECGFCDRYKLTEFLNTKKNHPDGSVRLWQAGNEGKDNADIFLSIQDPELP